jgi:hypothetical protein
MTPVVQQRSGHTIVILGWAKPYKHLVDAAYASKATVNFIAHVYVLYQSTLLMFVLPEARKHPPGYRPASMPLDASSFHPQAGRGGRSCTVATKRYLYSHIVQAVLK